MKLTNRTTPQAKNYQCDKCKEIKKQTCLRCDGKGCVECGWSGVIYKNKVFEEKLKTLKDKIDWKLTGIQGKQDKLIKEIIKKKILIDNIFALELIENQAVIKVLEEIKLEVDKLLGDLK